LWYIAPANRPINLQIKKPVVSHGPDPSLYYSDRSQPQADKHVRRDDLIVRAACSFDQSFCRISGQFVLEMLMNLEDFKRESDDVLEEYNDNKKDSPEWFYYTMVFVGVVVTGTMSYSLCRRGMSKSWVPQQWLSFVSALPVVLLEGSALGLMYARHRWFKSQEERKLGHNASKVVWGVLIVNSITEFALGFSGNGELPGVLQFYTRYIFPLAIVAIPVPWKSLYDRKPKSQQRLAVLEMHAQFRTGLLRIQERQQGMMLDAYRNAINSPAVKEAQQELFEHAAIEHAEQIAGFIDKKPRRRDHGSDRAPGRKKESR
jgi:hypothetical protein